MNPYSTKMMSLKDQKKKKKKAEERIQLRD